jgi:hypothetical protein
VAAGVRAAVLAFVQSRSEDYPVRWVDELTSKGDFDGREYALEFFSVPASEQSALRRRLRPVRKEAEDMLGRPIVLVFHTPEATAKHYEGVVRQNLR